MDRATEYDFLWSWKVGQSCRKWSIIKGFVSMDRAIDYNNNNNNNISKAINPSVNNLHEAQNAVHVQLKLS